MALCQCLLAVRQTTTIAKCSNSFELLHLHLKNINEDFLAMTLINRLEETIRAELLMQFPVSLFDAIERSEHIEERNQALVDLGWGWKPTHK